MHWWPDLPLLLTWRLTLCTEGWSMRCRTFSSASHLADLEAVLCRFPVQVYNAQYFAPCSETGCNFSTLLQNKANNWLKGDLCFCRILEGRFLIHALITRNRNEKNKGLLCWAPGPQLLAQGAFSVPLPRGIPKTLVPGEEHPEKVLHPLMVAVRVAHFSELTSTPSKAWDAVEKQCQYLVLCRNVTGFSGSWGWRYCSSHDLSSFSFVFFVYTVLNCFLLNNNPPVIQHSQKNQTSMSEKGRPDSSVGFYMSMAVNQWCFLKMSCQKTDQATACFSCVYDSFVMIHLPQISK